MGPCTVDHPRAMCATAVHCIWDGGPEVDDFTVKTRSGDRGVFWGFFWVKLDAFQIDAFQLDANPARHDHGTTTAHDDAARQA